MNCDQSTNSLLSVQEAVDKIAMALRPITELEQCDLLDARGRTLATDIYSDLEVPPADNSAMDGYAFKHSDLASGKALKIIGKSFAGTPFTGLVNDGECVRIMTGAIVPDGADTVEMQENVSVDGGLASINVISTKGNAIRLAGEDIAKGSKVLKAGQVIRAIDIGILASLGIEHVPVYRKPKVAVLSTGDELTPPGTRLEVGQIYDSNRYAIIAMLKQANVDVIDLGLIKDDIEQIKAAFSQADKLADLVISSGGVSVGEADYTGQILKEMGNINFWKLAIKPGKPLAFGQLKRAYFFGLPGNPVSAVVTLQQIALPALSQMSGAKDTQTQLLSATASETFFKHPGRLDYQRAIFWQEQGKLFVRPTGPQGSGMLSSVLHANCYAVLERERGKVEAGENVNIQIIYA
ncbi:molybdopterin molybdotransferase MoeA [Agaribacter flavus]|uniref:Molybdopterin molybdenumtransferase n=1 Tax=Agaribacter flavus TaxID=1902781 RepID=A0ABV7FR89_9ALTE